ncbi:acetyl-CoA synthetase-like protein [Leucogyrophana mollusca]|uniref:Acetyl-CoA synthetase-like protein n=1 Tax=Leucogyrophana mollusca TaxID=85980 RepID=A0ACB8BMQ1_9AGAM|nr:acetyl-CoA synthetase-like protein [Leucogyrophana mollusca]
MSEFSGPPLDATVPDDLTIPQFFLDHHHPSRPVRKDGVPWLIEDGTGRKIGFEEIRARTFGFANGLSLRYGIKEDDVVLIFSPNDVDYPIAIWGAHRLGAIISGANPTYTCDELVHQIETTKATVIVAHPVSLDTALAAARVSGIPAGRVLTFGESSQKSVDSLVKEGLSHNPNFVERKLKPGEGQTKIAFLNFSSGTTGKPKAVAISHTAPITNVIATALHGKVGQNYCRWEDQRFRPGDVAAAVLPFFHIYGLVLSIHFMTFCGMSLVVIPKFNFTDFLKSIVTHKITHLMLVPPQIVLLCKHPAVKDYDLSGVRFLISGAAPLSAELMKQLVKVIPNAQVGQGYGLTESSTSITMYPTDQKIGTPGSAGRLLPGVVAKIIKQDGSLAGFNEPGELIVKMASLALGYYNNEKATRETFVNGWLHTGDEVVINENMEVFIVDRLKEIMKVRGFQVAPAELEGCLLDHPDVADTCVVPVPDDYSGEVPLAFVVLHASTAKRVADDPAEAEKVKASIMKHVEDNKVAYKRLAGGVEFTDVIPKNPSGKLLRRILRDRAREMKAKPKAKL